MESFSAKAPIIMTFSGNDPSGGAGVQADIETLASMGCRCAPVITSLTVQDTDTVKNVLPCPGEFLEQQARAILEDMPITAFKIGFLPSIESIEVIHRILTDYPKLPVILDPVFASGKGKPLSNQEMIEAVTSLLLPLTTICTPNTHEAKQLASEADSLDACAHQIMSQGADYVLITGGHSNTEKVENRLYTNFRCLKTFTWERLPHMYHGSGCTLAASIAGLAAQSLDIPSAVYEAQEYTWETLKAGYRAGMGQHIPNRFFWALPENLTFFDPKPSAANDETRR